jgi:hypothetical protein
MDKNIGERAMVLIGDVKKIDVDKDGKASGPFLRARVATDVAKPVRRGVLLKTKKNTPPECGLISGMRSYHTTAHICSLTSHLSIMRKASFHMMCNSGCMI